jgi:hypothetical protein
VKCAQRNAPFSSGREILKPHRRRHHLYRLSLVSGGSSVGDITSVPKERILRYPSVLIRKFMPEICFRVSGINGTGDALDSGGAGVINGHRRIRRCRAQTVGVCIRGQKIAPFLTREEERVEMFDESRSCARCGDGVAAGRAYHQSCGLLCQALGATNEHWHRNCFVCGYEWVEEP